jgi:hypothetical protein
MPAQSPERSKGDETERRRVQGNRAMPRRRGTTRTLSYCGNEKLPALTVVNASGKINQS